MAKAPELAFEVAARIGYPVMVRPSYVLGGRGMEIVYDEAALRDYLSRTRVARGDASEHPTLLVDQFLRDAVEVDVDVVADAAGGVVVGGIMEHIEEAGIHSGDSACALPPYSLPPPIIDEIRRQATRLAIELGVIGLMNTQFAVHDGLVYVIEAKSAVDVLARTLPRTAR